MFKFRSATITTAEEKSNESIAFFHTKKIELSDN